MLLAHDILNSVTLMTTIRLFLFYALLALPLAATACGPKKEESWNSYYYGTYRASSTTHNNMPYPVDNDASYVPLPGSWEDDQTPQGQKW